MAANQSHLSDFAPLDSAQVQAAVENFQSLSVLLEEEWETECAAYERTTDFGLAHRNYPNPDGRVQDEALYPYHSSLYPLLDAYDHLYQDGDDDHRPALDASAVRPSVVPLANRHYDAIVDDHDDDDDLEELVVEGYMPASVQSVMESLVQPSAKLPDPTDYFVLLQQVIDHHARQLGSWKDEVARKASQQGSSVAYWRQQATKQVLPRKRRRKKGRAQPPTRPFGPSVLPNDRSTRTRVLLRLLRHALSELQRDYRLAAATAVCLMRHMDFDDTDVLSRFLAILVAEYVACNEGACTEEDFDEGLADHHCFERDAFDRILVQALAYGMSSVEVPHATILAALGRWVLDREFGHVVESDAEADIATKRNLWLKRAALARRAEEDFDGEWTSSATHIPVDWLSSVIHALGLRATLEGVRLYEQVTMEYSPEEVGDEVLVRSLDTFHQCQRALVELGEAAIYYLPSSDRFYIIASAIVKSLCGMLAEGGAAFLEPKYEGVGDDEENEEDSDGATNNNEDGEDNGGGGAAAAADEEEEEFVPEYCALSVPQLKELRLCTSTRFADCITKASEQAAALRAVEALPETNEVRPRVVAAVMRTFSGRPHPDVQDVIRGLFIRDLVSIRATMCAYGDCVVWCRMDCHPLDPALFWYEYNFPVELDDEEEEEDEEEQREPDDRSIDWDTDEDGHLLTRGELRARFDFSLMLLLQAWHEPWTPESHASFQPLFRAAARTTMLVARRQSIPREIGTRIVEYMNRDWWPDERQQCWNYSCQFDAVAKQLERKLHARAGVTSSVPKQRSTLFSCPGCRVAMYCSEECRKQDYKVQHKHVCKYIPYKLPGLEEKQFISQVLGKGPPLNVEGMDAEAPTAAASAAEGDDETVELDGDDDDDWEDVDSEHGAQDNQATQSTTALIYKFFKDRSYVHRDPPHFPFDD